MVAEQVHRDPKKKRLKRCAFSGYNPKAEENTADVSTGHPVMFKRLLAASADDAHRDNTWKDSIWLDPEIWELD